MKLLIDSDAEYLSRDQIEDAYKLRGMGFQRFYIIDRGELTAQARLDISGINVVVSWSERGDTRAHVGGKSIWSSDNDFRNEEEEWFDIFKHMTDVTKFARERVAEWMRKEFKETTDD